jgi:hypothetical protein
MDRLRMECFPGAYDMSTSREEFDNRSWFPLIYFDNELAAYGRLTPGPSSVFEVWTKGKAEIPTGTDVVDLGRCMVSPKFRGLDLLRLVCLEAFLLASKLGYSQIVGAVIPGRRAVEVLHSLGFSNSGVVVEASEPNKTVLIQPLVISVSKNVENWIDLKGQILSDIRKKGVEIADPEDRLQCSVIASQVELLR